MNFRSLHRYMIISYNFPAQNLFYFIFFLKNVGIGYIQCKLIKCKINEIPIKEPLKNLEFFIK